MESANIREMTLKQWLDPPPAGPEELRERLDGCLEHFNEVEPRLHCFTGDSVDHGRIAEQLTALSISHPDPAQRPPLFGVPVAVKDIFNVDGYDTRAGSKLPAAEFAGREASLVTRLRQAGSIVFGKSVTTEFAYFQPGESRNPHNSAHTPGGSSSGSAAAVAAGIVPLALGTQTIGSVIRPAAFCGIVGYKPTAGLLPRDGVVSFSTSVDQLGFFTQDVAGMRELIEALGIGEAPQRLLRRHSVEAAAGTAAAPAIGLITGDYFGQADRRMQDQLHAAAEALREGGCRVRELDLFSELSGDITQINQAHRTIIARDFYHAHARRFRHYAELYSDSSRSLFEEGGAVGAAEYQDALELRERWMGALDRLAERHECALWISPAAPGVAPEGISGTGSPVMNLPWTFLGTPAVTFPAAWDAESALPYGLQLTAPRYADRALLEHAARLRDVLGG